MLLVYRILKQLSQFKQSKTGINISLLISGKTSIPREQPNQNKEMKIADSVLLSLFMRDNEKVQHLLRPLAPA